ncbi:MAG: LysM peptidoglycan-binding domain-containing protein [Anaerolineae bacterium]|nr:LysM peptidoglycan-binding domain-containing protein [Anaerolineae bacterium]
MIAKLYRPIVWPIIVGVLILITTACNLSTSNEPVPTIGVSTLPVGTVPATITPIAVTVVATIVQPAITVQPVVTVQPPAQPAIVTATLAPNVQAGGATGSNQGTCTPPSGWVAYTVQTGDSVSILADSTGATVAQLVSANCLVNADVIEVGQVIYLPHNPGAASSGGSASGGSGSASGGNVTNVNGPVIANVRVEPSTVMPNGEYLVLNGTTITLRAEGVINAVKVTFVTAPVGSNAAPVTIGVDSTLTDGIAVPWAINDAGLRVNVWAIATNSANESTQSQPVIVTTAPSS